MADKAPTRRCAIYTRKSSEEGLEQDFNSLDAQREAGESYIKSQGHEGWRLIRTSYDDGGYSGGTMERPGLQRLLQDIQAGRIDIVVVYKVDRLTRSLSDFARLVEIFEAHNASFVSVTQQFNTTTSMGRLMLNVLLSFAQFEREVTGERIRDKFLASRKKGLWMGGVPPIGYDLGDRRLVVNETEANIVRHIFGRFVELGCISKLMRELADAGHRTKVYVSVAGRTYGGLVFTRGHLYRILGNRTYLGEAVHKGNSYPGEHDPIIEPELWDRVHSMLTANRRRFRTDEGVQSPAFLKGIIHDDAGNPMSPSHAKRGRQRYRYYVSQAILQNRVEEVGSIARLPAHEIEKLIVDATLTRLKEHPATREIGMKLARLTDREIQQHIRALIRRVVVMKESIRVTIDLTRAETQGGVAQSDSSSTTSDNLLTIELPFKFVARGGKTRIIEGTDYAEPSAAPSPALIKGIARGHLWRQQLLNGEVRSVRQIARKAGVTGRYVSRILRLGFLAPELVESIIEGRQPPSLTVEKFREPPSYDWAEQRRMLGFAAA